MKIRPSYIKFVNKSHNTIDKVCQKWTYSDLNFTEIPYTVVLTCLNRVIPYHTVMTKPFKSSLRVKMT